jgi:soluble lytic murein transglycosylase-like protein
VQARTGSAGRAWVTTLASVAVALAAASSAGAQGAIYAYVDADGVAHFTNAPRDSRFVRLAWSAESVRPDERGAPTRWEYDGLIGLSARQHRVPPALVKAVIAAESCFDPSAVSRKGAQGLMQLMPETARSLGVSDPLRPEQNVDGGVRYLRDMMDRYGTLSLALAAYNAGPEAVDRHGGVPPYPETRDYVKRVLTYYRAYDGDFRR